ncbi:MAG: hypothetical protein QS748_12480 [Candidatus Endonucleobacter bathymodioli]|uniref:Uncharacterized protein n=1 Tax=Candidatus Endonucleibacter bathymodioli TaxID=539814 RepID=A0AA90NN98_9GAMM|nr:hypothetical protein [Candidatus Endonucleobacter bathymodioli]
MKDEFAIKNSYLFSKKYKGFCMNHKFVSILVTIDGLSSQESHILKENGDKYIFSM